MFGGILLIELIELQPDVAAKTKLLFQLFFAAGGAGTEPHVSIEIPSLA